MIARYLTAILLRQRGDNRKLATEIVEKLSEESQTRLYRVLDDLQMEVSRERTKRKRNFT